ncbi:hypothetical protein GCK72_021192 [Caenorhabditis remanei]|uniref:F-box domain-containing protein n=1 Tax=Caenorhabditis remanei TaxID=31234 RepID=A0A6A5GJX0_CAERE|nr:hypothetical protein GCK72_021192 [Caenorhabditis remanei]KAF1754629.1 hypothetical protein GCK72_021192 [Caenorhabditis remanei]
MAHSFQNSTHLLRPFILYEALDQAPVFLAYQNFARKIGQDSMSYQDFEFWYMRFLRGEYDMNYDRSQDPNPRSLMQLPLEIMELITDELDIRQRMVFRKVCRNLRTIIDMKPSTFQKIRVIFESDKTRLWLDDGTRDPHMLPLVGYGRLQERNDQEFDRHSVKFMSKSDRRYIELEDGDCLVRCGFRNKIVSNAKHWEMAMNDVTFALKNPNQVLEELVIENKSLDNFEEFEPKLRGLTQKIRVKKLKIVTNYSNEETMILPYIDPETIERVEVEMVDSKVGMRVGKEKRIRTIVEYDQWKRAETPILYCHSRTVFPIGTLMDCPRFTLRFHQYNGFNKFLKIVQALLTSPVLQCAKIGFATGISVPDRAKVIATIGGIEIGWMHHRVPISNSQEFFTQESVDDFSTFVITRIQ